MSLRSNYLEAGSQCFLLVLVRIQILTNLKLLVTFAEGAGAIAGDGAGPLSYNTNQLVDRLGTGFPYKEEGRIVKAVAFARTVPTAACQRARPATESSRAGPHTEELTSLT
jgi:hypothetical protein